MTAVAIFLAACFLAYSNGSNDNFKGVATLLGSRTSDYKTALRLATAATLAGSAASVYWAQSLIKHFSGCGLVPDAVISPSFLLSVAIGAGLTVIIASLTGFPVSTTHGLIGALAGSGLVAIGTRIDLAALKKTFFLPLFFSPLIAVALAAMFYLIFHRTRLRLGISKESCLCLGKVPEPVPADQSFSLTCSSVPAIGFGSTGNCKELYTGNLMGINAQTTLDFFHYLSAGIMSFARGLNDTPKIAALLFTVKALDIRLGVAAIAAGIAAGGLLGSRKIAETMSYKIVDMNDGQGFTANLVTGILVTGASRLGLPVSTTHVSVGSLFGIGLVNGKIDYKMFSEVILSWVLTLPIAAVLSGTAYRLLTGI